MSSYSRTFVRKEKVVNTSLWEILFAWTKPLFIGSLNCNVSFNYLPINNVSFRRLRFGWEMISSVACNRSIRSIVFSGIHVSSGDRSSTSDDSSDCLAFSARKTKMKYNTKLDESYPRMLVDVYPKVLPNQRCFLVLKEWKSESSAWEILFIQQQTNSTTETNRSYSVILDLI